MNYKPNFFYNFSLSENTHKLVMAVMAAKVTGLTHKSTILWQLVAGSCTTCCSLS